MSLETIITQVFCSVDDFCCEFEPWMKSKMLSDGTIQRKRKNGLSLSEIITILVCFHRSGYREFKKFYLEIYNNYRYLFPNIVSYSRFVQLQPRAVLGLWGYINCRKSIPTGLAFIDSTKIAVCGNKRISRNKVFKDVAKIGKSTMGWFFGFKLHLIINEYGEILSCNVTRGNVDDRVPVPQMVKNLFGYLFGDKGYISKKLTGELKEMGINLVTQVKKNMKKKLLSNYEQVMLRKRSLIEIVNDQLKNISQIEHTRHRSVANFLTNLFAGIIAYMFQEKKPSIKFKFKTTQKDLVLA